MQSVDINYLAVLVCGALSMVSGALWYGPIFGKAWMQEIGKTEEELKEAFNPAKTYSLAILGHLIMALVLAYFISLTGASTIVNGLRVALAGWVGLIAAPFFINGLFNDKSTRLFVIDAGYQLVNCIVFGIVLVLW
jgi:glucan phosphoethanolaminetransferase (alkaline phosphatase superfamily)